MIEKINKWLPVLTFLLVLVIAVAVLVGGNNQSVLGSGTRFPNGLSADTTSPSAGQVRGTTLVFTSTGGISTSTPSTTMGELSVGGTGTTTLYIGSGGTKGGCIQTTNDAGTLTKIYVTGTTVTAAAGSCK